MLYDAKGNVIAVEQGGATASVLPLAANPIAKRTNIVHYAEVAAGASGYFQEGLSLINTGDAREITLTWSIDVVGTATKVGLMVDTHSCPVHDYAGGEQTFSDTFTAPQGRFLVWLPFVTTAGDPKNATARTFKIASLPYGIELIGTGYHWAIDLGDVSLTYDEEDTRYPHYNSRFNNRRYMAMGDSITQGVAPYYVSIVGQKLGCLHTINRGRGGSSMTDLANAVDTFGYQGMDLITIAHGVNGNQPEGTIQPRGSVFNKDTFIGAAQFVIETIQANSPKSQIVLITPIASGAAGKVNREDTGRRKALHDIAEFYGLPCIPGTEIISDANKAQYLGNDALHPNAAGQEHYGVELAKRLAAL